MSIRLHASRYADTRRALASARAGVPGVAPASTTFLLSRCPSDADSTVCTVRCPVDSEDFMTLAPTSGENPLFDGLGSPIDGLPLSFPEHVRQLIEAEIVAGGLAPDERVTEKGLAERFGVSRTPVREAMRLLESQGLIVRPRGRSAYSRRTRFGPAVGRSGPATRGAALPRAPAFG